MTGFFGVDPQAARGMVARLAHPQGQEGISDIHAARLYTRDIVRLDPCFSGMVASRDGSFLDRYDREIAEHLAGYGITADTGLSN